MSQCECHDQQILAACLSCQAFLCKECLMSHDLNDQLAYFTDYIKDNYDSIQKIGEGSLTKVYKARSKSSQVFYAVKVIKDFESKPTEAQDQVLAQVYANEQMDHKSIVKQIISLRSNGNLYIVQELGDSSISQKFIQTFKMRKRAVSLIVQLLEGVKYLHDKGQTHYMLKPSNILMVKDKNGGECVKICDSGIVKNINFITITSQSNINGFTKYSYFPPEFFQEEQKQFTQAIDIWSLGCLIHQILTNIHPFLNRDARSMEDLKFNIINGKFTMAKGLQGTIYSSIIHSCLRQDPNKRASANELLQAFLKIQDIYAKYNKEEDAESVLKEVTSKLVTGKEDIEKINALIPVRSKQLKKFESDGDEHYAKLMFQNSSPSKQSNLFSGSEDEENDTRNTEYKDDPTPSFNYNAKKGHQETGKETFDKHLPKKGSPNVPSLHLSGKGERAEDKISNSQKSSRRARQVGHFEGDESSEEDELTLTSVQERSESQEQSTIINDDGPKSRSEKKTPQVIKVKKYMQGAKKEEEKMGQTYKTGPIKPSQSMDLKKQEEFIVSNKSRDSQRESCGNFVENEIMNDSSRQNTLAYQELKKHLNNDPSASQASTQRNFRSPNQSIDSTQEKEENKNLNSERREYMRKAAQQVIPSPQTGMSKEQKQQQFRMQPAKSNLEFVYSQMNGQENRNQYFSGANKSMRSSFDKKDRVRQYTSPSQRKLFQPARTQLASQIKTLDLDSDSVIENVHSGMLWQIKRLTPETYASCSNEKVIKFWNITMKEPYDHIYLDQPLNSITPALVDKGLFQYIAGGTFSGGIVLVSISKQKMVKFLDRQHKSYVSQSICLSFGKRQYFATISSDSIKIWLIENDSFQMVIQIDLGFSPDGDYKWWDLCEITSKEFLDHSKETLIGCCSSKDFQTRIYSVNFINNTHLHLYTFNQNFHPRSLQQLTHYPSADKLLVAVVGMVDDKNSFDGCVEVFNVIHGQGIVAYTENARLCSIACLKTDIDLIEKKDIEHLFVGTSDRKIIEFVYKDCEITKMRDIDTVHKKSIFGMLVMNSKTILSGSLDSKITVHSVTN